MTKSENVPILGIFLPKTTLMFRVGLKKIRVGRQQEPPIFHLSLNWENQTWYWEKKMAIFDWEWGRNSAPRDGQKRPC